VPAEVPLVFDPQPLWKIIDRRTKANGIESARRRCFCDANIRSDITSIRTNQVATWGKMLAEVRKRFAKGMTVPCPVVNTLMVALLPCINELGVAEHVLIGAVVEQLKTTVKEKPSTPVELTAFL
jgi:hypothetical protein